MNDGNDKLLSKGQMGLKGNTTAVIPTIHGTFFCILSIVQTSVGIQLHAKAAYITDCHTKHCKT
jgi:hypothetical protein